MSIALGRQVSETLTRLAPDERGINFLLINWTTNAFYTCELSDTFSSEIKVQCDTDDSNGCYRIHNYYLIASQLCYFMVFCCVLSEEIKLREIGGKLQVSNESQWQTNKRVLFL
jgi:hypothetical protein